MLAMVFVVLPSLVGFAFWHSNRQNRDNSYQPVGGRKRWTGDGQGSAADGDGE